MTVSAGGLGPMDRAARIAAVVASLAECGCDALIVSKPENIRWLCGFTGSSGIAVVAPDGLTVITDNRYERQIDEQLQDAAVEAAVHITRDRAEPLASATAAVDRVGLEAETVTWADQQRFEEYLEGRTLVSTAGVIETLRRIKDDGEINRLKAAAAIADEALAEVKPELGRGRTEQWLARTLNNTMLELGADGLSFPTIVAGGPNSAKPHARPSDRTIEPGDMVVMDFGASVDGYGSDMTRSFLIGEPSARQREIFDAVIEAQAAGVAAVTDGVAERDVDAACRNVMVERGLGEAFSHGTGHGIGLEIHENPILSTRATGILRTGYVVTVEPGAYLPELGGIRIEDSVVVTDDGCEPITLSPKNPDVETSAPQ